MNDVRYSVLGYIKTTLKNRAAKNAAWLIAGRIIQMMISFVVGVLTTRYLGPENYGLIGYAMAYTVFFAAIATLGINSVIVRELVDNRDREGTVLGTAMTLEAVSSFISALLIVAIVSIADRGDKTIVSVAALCSLGFVLSVLGVFNYRFQSELKSEVTAKAALLGYSAGAAFKIYLLATGKSVVWFAAASSVDYVFAGALLLAAYRKSGGRALRFSWDYGKALLAKSRHFILPMLMVSVYAQTDRIMLRHMCGANELGYYTSAFMLCTAWCFVLQAVIDSVFPSIMENSRDGKTEEFIKQNKKLYAAVFYVSIFVSVLFFVFAKPMVSLLFGSEYAGTTGVLRILTWFNAFSYLGVARNAWVVCLDKQRHLTLVYVSAAVINLALNFMLIPVWGAKGAAVTSLLAQVITSIAAPMFIRELRPNAKMMLEAIALKDLK